MPVNHNRLNPLIDSLHNLFIRRCQALAHSSGFCRRTSRLKASAWVQGLVFGWLSNPQASVSALARSIAVAGATVSPQAVQKRFGTASASLLRGVLESLMPHALQQAAQSGMNRREFDWLGAFPAIWLRDSTLITLPLELRKPWPGSGGFAGPSAALKASVQWEWHSGQLAPLHLSAGLDHDQKVAEQQDALALQNGHRLVPGEMHVFDLGYFDLRWMAHLHAQNAYFCCRYKAGTHLKQNPLKQNPLKQNPLKQNPHCIQQNDEKKPSTLLKPPAKGINKGTANTSLQAWLDALPSSQQQVEWEVQMGKKACLPVRLIAVRVPDDIARQLRDERTKKNERKGRNVTQERLELLGWNLYITNAPAAVLNIEQVKVLYRLRWQIERLFRLWKETLAVDEWRTKQPQRILCEIFAKLIGAVLTQKLTAFCLWHDPARSLVKCAQTISAHAMALLIHLDTGPPLRDTLRALQRACLVAAKIESRSKKPSTCQKLAVPK